MIEALRKVIKRLHYPAAGLRRRSHPAEGLRAGLGRRSRADHGCGVGLLHTVLHGTVAACAMSVAGAVFGIDAARAEILAHLRGLLGEDGAVSVAELLLAVAAQRAVHAGHGPRGAVADGRRHQRVRRTAGRARKGGVHRVGATAPRSHGRRRQREQERASAFARPVGDAGGRQPRRRPGARGDAWIVAGRPTTSSTSR